MRQTQIGFLFLIALVLAGAGVLLWSRPASAQCGSSVSSCKNCHEVKGQDPVNNKGAWHTSHAFGDFCEFCHGGNVKGKDKTEAHVGLVDPMADVKASCQSCHPNDLMDRANKYVTVLGVSITAGGGSSGTPVPGAAGTTTGGSNPPTSGGPAAPTGGTVIDLNKVYAESLAPASTNVGDAILVVMILGTLAVLGALVWHYEKPLPRLLAAWHDVLSTPALATATPSGATVDLKTAIANKPELSALLPMLATSDTRTLRAVSNLLADKKYGPRVLQALSQTDLQTLAALGESDQKALSAILALAREME